MNIEKRTYRPLSITELLSNPKPLHSGSYELTEEEKITALKEAQQKKEAAIKYDEDNERRKKWQTALTSPWSSKDLISYVKWRANKNDIEFKIDQDNEHAIMNLALYFTDNPEFETKGEGFSLKKGIILRGNTGTGKTTIMKLFSANQRASYRVIRPMVIAERFKVDGDEILNIFSKYLPAPNHADTLFQTQLGACFDDLGAEDLDKQHFGSYVNVMANIISKRYDDNILPFYFTHVTTNLTAQQIEEMYGSRVRSRMRSMFNLIELGGQDRR